MPLTNDDFLLTQLSARELIERLDVAYPHRCIASGQPQDDAHRYAGARQLIDHLKAMLDEEQENVIA